eukprot:3292334-Amphidinium_carterae.1
MLWKHQACRHHFRLKVAAHDKLVRLQIGRKTGQVIFRREELCKSATPCGFFLKRAAIVLTPWRGYANPYVLCSTTGKSSSPVQTRVVEKSLSPVWHEELRIEPCAPWTRLAVRLGGVLIERGAHS